MWTEKVDSDFNIPLLFSKHTLPSDIQHRPEHKKILPITCKQFDVLSQLGYI